MRIAMILDKDFPPDVRVENEAKLLLEHGHSISLFCLGRNDHDSQEIINGIHVFRYKKNWLLNKLSALVYTVPVYSWIVSLKIADFLSRVEPDVIHVHDIVIAEASFKANKEYQFPVVLDLHENRPEIMKMYKHVNQFPGKYLINLNLWSKKQKEFIQEADFTVVVTEEAKKEILNYENTNENSVVVVPNTINKDLYYGYGIDPQISSKTGDYFTLLYMGDTALRRGTDTAIKATALLKDKIPNILLLLVGKSSQDDQLKQLVNVLNISDHVSFEGWQDISLFPSYVAASDICLCPLKRNLHHDTTFANKLFQYMAMSKPVIVSDCPSQANLITQEQCGLVHRADNEEDLAAKIYTLYQDEDLRISLGKHGKEAVNQKFNWDKTGQQLLDLYESINGDK